MSEERQKRRRKKSPARIQAEGRFAEMAMPLAVSAELGLPYRTVWGWHKDWLAESADADDGDAA